MYIAKSPFSLLFTFKLACPTSDRNNHTSQSGVHHHHYSFHIQASPSSASSCPHMVRMESFTRSNGQIYTERTSGAVRSMVPSWKKHCTGKRIHPRKYRRIQGGASSLKVMALRACCWNAEIFTPEALEYPGWHYASMIHKQLKIT